MRPVLTPKQYEIARLAAAQLPYPEIARRVGSSRSVVSKILERLRARLDAPTRRHLAVALLACEVRDWDPAERGGRPAKHGFKRGDAVSITGGRWAGRTGTYLAVNSVHQFRIRVAGTVAIVSRKFIVRIEQQEAA